MCTKIGPRDYHEELKAINDLRDPQFKVEHTKLWLDNLPTAAKPMTDAHLQQADGKIQKLVLDQSKIQFQADSLSLARDASQLASLHAEEVQCERSMRMAKVAHLKQENQIGSGIVTKHMAQCCAFTSGPMNLLKPMLTEARLKQNMVLKCFEW